MVPLKGPSHYPTFHIWNFPQVCKSGPVRCGPIKPVIPLSRCLDKRYQLHYQKRYTRQSLLDLAVYLTGPLDFEQTHHRVHHQEFGNFLVVKGDHCGFGFTAHLSVGSLSEGLPTGR